MEIIGKTEQLHETCIHENQNYIVASTVTLKTKSYRYIIIVENLQVGGKPQPRYDSLYDSYNISFWI